IFNLSLPATQTGDMYAMLLKLDEFGISTDHLIFNVRYASFLPRYEYEKALFWWMDDLKVKDIEAYRRALPHDIYDNEEPITTKSYKAFKSQVEDRILPQFHLYAYKDYLAQTITHAWDRQLSFPIPDDSLAPSAPWYEKETKSYLEQDVIKRSFTDKPLDLSPKNTDIYFMNKIIEHQKSKKTFLVLTGTNQTLMKDFIEKPGYQDNLQKLDHYLASLPVGYLNLEGLISDQLFTDHTHLMPEGYRELGRLVWHAYESQEENNK
ncbi:hypothetical protein, partial [Paenibacillus sp. N3.4]|uniref:hypothetical protein n=1 Tax=Paenibacillus sp. N3.4 TaxID=2603222 RepID=UPI00164EFFED